MGVSQSMVASVTKGVEEITFVVPITPSCGQSPHIVIKLFFSWDVDATVEDFVGSDHLQFKRKSNGQLLAG